MKLPKRLERIEFYTLSQPQAENLNREREREREWGGVSEEEQGWGGKD